VCGVNHVDMTLELTGVRGAKVTYLLCARPCRDKLFNCNRLHDHTRSGMVSSNSDGVSIRVKGGMGGGMHNRGGEY